MDREREGWFFPGQRGAPTVVVAHGYRAQRADVLTLVTALQEQQFNVFLSILPATAPAREYHAGLQGNRGASIGGAGVIRARRRGSKAVRPLGSGYGRLCGASSWPRPILASPLWPSTMPMPIRSDMVQVEVNRSGLAVLPGVSTFTDVGFRMLNFAFRTSLRSRLDHTQGIPKLFIESDDRPDLANPREAFQQRAGTETVDPRAGELSRHGG